LKGDDVSAIEEFSRVHDASSASDALVVREIGVDDHAAVAAYLGAGIGYPQSYFDALLATLRTKGAPPGYPEYGYVATIGRRIVGAILLIFSAIERDGSSTIRCHVTSWCVEKKYRPLAASLFARGLKYPDVTYINISAGPEVRPIIEAQGFKEYSRGQFVFSPLVHALKGPLGAAIQILDWRLEPDAACEPYEAQLMRDHGGYGCLSFWCVHAGRAYPFVFYERAFKTIIPGVQLLYCRSVDSIVRFSGPISRFLARRNKLFVSVDANGPIAGLVGHYFPGKEPRYFKGAKPRLGDLAYTQKAMRPFMKRKFTPRDEGPQFQP
jgi:hypothetical protein